ncbi:hypothetical protein DE146DRAFT_601008 [Phaeosphaeria sp. MPI-PUGE-AT-0046c]|nr:hypothetical protein DE146DRAFT_601008 [Phaeosphaeria sp. MPI-PUGE-AT-0046c]
MAFMLYRFIRRKIKERKATEAVSTTDGSHLVPDFEPGQEQHEMLQHSKHDQTTNNHKSLNTEEAAQQKEERRKRNIRQLNFNWIVAAYTLTFTTFVPASGQLADIYGRHFALQFEMFWIVIGSVLCAAAQSWGMLLLGRALQGLGAAGIMSLSRIILSDGATLAENARNNSVLSIISGVSYAIGPVIGGYIADGGWRYIFVLPVGVSVLAIVLIFLLMRKELVHGRASAAKDVSRRLGYISGLRIIDWPGMLTFILGVGLVILAIQWGGTSYAWDSPTIYVCFIVGGVLCVVFFVYEYLLGPGRVIARIFPNQVPMIPSTLFRKKDTSLLMIINFSAGISLVSAFYFISYYWQLAEGYSSSQAGIQLLYYTPGLGVGVYSAMFLCNRWPRQTFFPLLWGSIVEGIGLALLTYSISIRHQTMVKVFLAVAGAGTGLRFMPVVLHAAGIWSTRIPSMQSLLSFMLPLGETIGISMMGSVFSNKLSTSLASIAQQNQSLNLPSSGVPSLDILNNLPAAAKNDVQNAAARAVMWSLISVLPFVGLSIVASTVLGNVWIGKAAVEAKDDKPAQAEEKGKVMSGLYIPALFSGDLEAHKQDLDVNHGHEQDAGQEKVGDVRDDADLAQPERAHAGGRQVWV